MWSPRAEQVVLRLIAGLAPERLDPARTHAVRLSALPIGEDMWSDYYLRPNGQVVIVGQDLEHPDGVNVNTDPLRLLMILVWGSERYPELRELLPAKESGAIDCRCLQHPNIFGPRKVIRPECGGVGWLPARGVG